MFKPNSNTTTTSEINYFIDSSCQAYTNREVGPRWGQIQDQGYPTSKMFQWP